MFMKKIQDKHIFVLYLLIFFGVAAAAALLQPLKDTPPLYGNPPDEAYRYLVPKFICENGYIPNGYEESIRIPSYGISYAFYTILPYIIQGYVMRFVSLFTDSELLLLYTARFVDVFFGLCMAAVVYGIGCELFEDRRFKWMFCVLVTYLPQNVFVHSYVNNDSLCMLSTALIVYATIKIWKAGAVDVRNACMLALGIVFCAQSYYNAYGYILCSILLFPLWFLYQKENGHISCRWKEFWKWGGLIAGIVLIGAGSLFIRNAVLYNGDFLGMSAQAEYGIQNEPGIQAWRAANTFQARGISVMQMLTETQLFRWLFMGFVSIWGSLSIQTSILIYWIYGLILLTGFPAFFICRRKCKEDRIEKIRDTGMLIGALLCIIIPVALCVYYCYTEDFQRQGRYVLPAAVPLMCLVTLGIEKLTNIKAVPKWSKTACSFFVIAFGTASLLWVFFHNALPVYLEIGSVL